MESVVFLKKVYAVIVKSSPQLSKLKDKCDHSFKNSSNFFKKRYFEKACFFYLMKHDF